MKASILFFAILLCITALLADDYVYDHFITVDPSQPVSEQNALNISDALCRAYAYAGGNTLITAVVADLPPFVVYPTMCSNRVVKVLGTRISDTQMTTITGPGANYLAWVGEDQDRTGNVIIIENIKFQGGSTAVEIDDINELEIYFNNCIFSGQALWAFDASVPFSLTNSKIELPSFPGYAQGAIRITGLDENSSDLVASICGNTFTGRYSDHLIQAGIWVGTPCFHHLRAVDIEDNRFEVTAYNWNNYTSGNGAIQAAGVQTVNINRNVFHLNSVAGSPYPYQIRVYDPFRMDLPRVLKITNNTIWSADNQNNFSGMSINKRFQSARIMNNVIVNMTGVGVSFEGEPVTGTEYAVQNNDIFNCSQAITNAGSGTGWIVNGQLSCDPMLDAEYRPLWTSAALSPCVDAGNRDTDGDGIYWAGGGGFSTGEPDDSDADRSPLDIGAIPAADHQFEDYPMPVAGAIKWMSFPVVNEITTGYNQNASFFSSILDEEVLDWVTYKQGNNALKSLYFTNLGLINGSDQVSSGMGYKVKLLPGVVTSYKLSTPGFLEEPTTSINLYRYQQGTNTVNENWIGYFNSTSAAPLTAFSQVLDHLTSIRTQYWSMVKMPKTGVWMVSPGNLTLNYGDMVIVTVDQDCSFTWNNAVPVDPKTRTQAVAFTYEEKPDYTPLYIFMDNLEELPDEIGIYVDGVCKGAVKVQDDFTDLCVYLDANESLNPDNCELVLYYSDKSVGEQRLISKPGADQLQRVSGNGLNFYTLNLFGKANQETVHTGPALAQNSPNPFNPSTCISYELPDGGFVSVEVFNQKGQQLRSLLNGYSEPGKHQVWWDGKDEQGRIVASGVYYYRLYTSQGSIVKKMLLLK